MNLSAPFILRPIMTMLLLATVTALGVFAFLNLPVSNLPDVNYPVITVTVPFPGTNPVTMANTVASPLEKQFMTIPGIRYVTSASVLGSTSIILEFDINKNIDLAAVDVDSAIVAARPQLPPNLPQEPSYKKVNPSSTPVIYIAVTSSTMTQGEIYDYANTFIGQRISIIEGVSQVQVFGSPFAVRAQVDSGRAASYGLTLGDVANVISNQNQYQPLGQFDGNYTATTIYDNGGLFNSDGYNPIIINYKNGSPVRLNDIGKAVDGLKLDRSFRRFIDGELDQPSVTLAVQSQPGANIVKITDAIHELLPKLQEQLPGALDLIVIFDRSLSIRSTIEEMEFTLLVAFILVVLVIFVYLGIIRDTMIPAIAMPVSILATLFIIYYIGYTLDNLSLLAFILAIGFIIDDAIVVLENIVRHQEMGKSPLDAALEGSQQISFTIVSMTLSLVAVFIPLIFMAGIIGKLFREFSITLTIVTIASGIVSLTLTPMLCSLFLSSEEGNKKEPRMLAYSKRLNEWMLNHYKNGLTRVLHYRKTMLIIGVISVVLSLLLFKILPTDFIPDEDIGFILAYTEADQGTSSDQMRDYQQQVVKVLRNEQAINSITSITANPVYRQGIVLLSLVPRNERKAIGELIQDYNKKLKGIPGINVYLKNIPLIDLNIGPQVRGNYQYLMQSLDSDALYKSADALYQKMRDDPTFVGISTDLEIKTPQLNMDIQRDLASTLGVDAFSFETSLLLSYSGNRVSRIQTPIDQYDVIVEQLRDMQRYESSLNDVYLRSSTSNQLVPLRAIANWSEGVGPASINHFAQFPAVTITFNLAPGIPLSEGLKRLDKIAKSTLNPKVTGDLKGAAETFQESINSVAWLLIITIFTIYIVLGILYESLVHPLTILSTLPPAIVGALLTLLITGKPLSLYAFLGIILLIGIVKKNGILMVDFALDNIRTKGETPEKSIYDACIIRFRPIMMTTVAAIMGAVPIALGLGSGAESRRPLGYVIIGGMVVSQLITLFLTPVIYLYFEEWREKLLRKRKGEEAKL